MCLNKTFKSLSINLEIQIKGHTEIKCTLQNKLKYPNTGLKFSRQSKKARLLLFYSLNVFRTASVYMHTQISVYLCT